MDKRFNTQADIARKLREKSEVTPEGCIRWTGHVDANGYGKISYQGKDLLTHRAAYVTANGSIPGGAHILHKCDNPACINPDHLTVGTNRDNILDKAMKGRAGKRLDKAAVTEIKGMIAMGAKQQEIATHFGVNQSSISDISRGKAWRFVEMGAR